MSIVSVFLISSWIAYAVSTGLTGLDQQKFLTYTRHHDIPAGSVQLGPTAPSIDVTDTALCVAFDADAEQIGLVAEVPDEWTGLGDFTLDIDWHPEDGDQIQNGETVKWDISWRSIEYGEAIDNGTVATGTVTYTEAGSPGIDKEYIDSEITIPFTGGNQPLEAGDNMMILFDRDVSGDSYSGDAIVCQWYFVYSANKLATH